MKKQTGIGILLVLIAGTLWGTMGVFVNYFNAIGMSSVDIAGTRVIVGVILVSGFALLRDRSLFRIKRQDIWCFLGSGIVSLMLFTVCYFRTITLSSMSVAAILLYTSPVFVILLSLIIFKEKLTLRKAVSCIVCVVGCTFVAGIIGTDTSIGLMAFALGITSGIAYALYSIFSRFALIRGYASLTITIYTFLFAAFGLSFFVDFGKIATLVTDNSQNVVMIILLGLVTASLPYLLYTMGLERLESGKAAVIAAIEPVVATIIGSVFYKDNLSLIQFTGIALVLFSIAIQNIKAEKN